MEETRRVLVADDDPAILDLLTFNLKAEGFDVLAATDGDQAWSLARHAVPDLVVLDVMMPQRDGLDVLGSLKSHPRTRHIPVVLLTAKASDAEVWEGWRAGADYYITKPFSLDELLHFVEYLLRPASTTV
ncbi:MAG: two-component system, OmpR family, phosphate regulon response regulator PhoB [Acidimicrobiaceae bacterium]|jgi:DNA-binding response OmpR family regulator|nr:two-component system, OmpR family, phosphate regulon response regulator PhoB [Acidimicrobiaceae bacterium]MDQ1446690.1 two-component system, OmpR family, phosphate regulon response regulator PhoB [Acidimicrobiaceae bacterium]